MLGLAIWSLLIGCSSYRNTQNEIQHKKVIQEKDKNGYPIYNIEDAIKIWLPSDEVVIDSTIVKLLKYFQQD